MYQVLWAVSIVMCVLILIVLRHINSRPVSRSKDEVLSIINSWLNDKLSSGEWDYFENCEIQNPELEAIRNHCVKLSLDPEFTINPKASSALNLKGKAEASRIIATLSSANVLMTPNPTVKRDSP
jgi:hypothetical protein